MTKIIPGTFAEACYDTNSIAELEAALNSTGPADAADCAEWGLTPMEWSEQIALALDVKMAEAAGEPRRI